MINKYIKKCSVFCTIVLSQLSMGYGAWGEVAAGTQIPLIVQKASDPGLFPTKESMLEQETNDVFGQDGVHRLRVIDFIPFWQYDVSGVDALLANQTDWFVDGNFDSWIDSEHALHLKRKNQNSQKQFRLVPLLDQERAAAKERLKVFLGNDPVYKDLIARQHKMNAFASFISNLGQRIVFVLSSSFMERDFYQEGDREGTRKRTLNNEYSTLVDHLHDDCYNMVEKYQKFASKAFVPAPEFEEVDPGSNSDVDGLTVHVDGLDLQQ